MLPPGQQCWEPWQQEVTPPPHASVPPECPGTAQRCRHDGCWSLGEGRGQSYCRVLDAARMSIQGCNLISVDRF